MSRYGALILRILIAGAIVMMLNLPAVGQKWGEVTDSEKVMGPPANFPEAPAVIIIDAGELQVERIGPSQPYHLVRYTRIKIFNKNAAANIADVEIPLKEDDKIANLRAETITPTGDKVSVADFYTKERNGYKYITFTFPAVENGAIVEYQYVKTSHQAKYIGLGFEPWYFQNALYTVESYLGLDVPFLAGFDIIPHNFEGGQVVRENARSYRAQDIMPAKIEPLVGGMQQTLVALQLNFVSGPWVSWGRVYSRAADERLGRKQEIAALAGALANGLTAGGAITRRIFDFVHDSIKDSPDTARIKTIAEMIKRRTSSHGFKNEILTALLQEARVKAHLLMIGTRTMMGKFRPQLVDMGQFDRTICYVELDSSRLALDVDPEFVTYPYLPHDELTNGGLLLDGDSSRTIALQLPDRPSSRDVIATIWLRSDGSALCSSSVDLRGYMIEAWQWLLSDTTTSESVVRAFLENSEMRHTVLEMKKTTDSSADRVNWEIVMELPDFGRVIDSSLFFAPYPFPSAINHFISERRVFPVDFSFPFQVRHRIRINLPEGMTVTDLPQEVHKYAPGATFSRKLVTDGQIIDSRVDLKIDVPYFEVKGYPALKALYDAMAASGADKVAATKH